MCDPDPDTIPACPRCGDCIVDGVPGLEDDDRTYCRQKCADSAHEDRMVALYERVGPKGMEYRFGPQRP